MCPCSLVTPTYYNVVRVHMHSTTATSIIYFCLGVIPKPTVSNTECSNKTAYVHPDKKTAEVMQGDGHIVKLPPGEYEFQRSLGSSVCTYYVLIKSKYLPVCLFVYTSFYFVVPGLPSQSDNLYTT